MSYSFNHINGVEFDEQLVKAVIEIPKGSQHKVEWDRHLQYFVLDRVEPQIFIKPVNYGFIPQTLDEDGDELDVLLITKEPLPLGVVVTSKVLGVLEFIDDNEADHKIICVPADDRDCPLNELKDVSSAYLKQIQHHFSHYKDLKNPGTTKVLGFGDTTKAWQVIKQCHKRALANPWW